MLTTPAPLWDPPGPWVKEALCAQADPDAWFPAPGDAAGARKAVVICAQCPVRVQCLTYAVENNEGYGVWGGLTVKERQALRRRRRAA